MTAKIVVLYTQPDDPEAFDRDYFETHMPLVSALPGLLRSETGKFGTKQHYYRGTNLYFEDRAALNAALGSEAGSATTADYERIAPPGSMVLVQQVDD
jgi:uncharacterized protein (TIGR02118 family)